MPNVSDKEFMNISLIILSRVFGSPIKETLTFTTRERRTLYTIVPYACMANHNLDNNVEFKYDSVR